MLDRSSIAAIALMAALVSTIPAAQAFDDAKYPDMKGAWHRALAPMPRFDPSKPRGLAQQPPLTPEFQALFEASLADQAAGGQGNHTVYTCLAWGMPGGRQSHDGSKPCPPAFWSAVFHSKSAWYSGVSGAFCPAATQRGGIPPRSHLPFQSGYFVSSNACAPVVAMHNAAASTIAPIELW